MTVAELILKLQEVQNKELPVAFPEESGDYRLITEVCDCEHVWIYVASDPKTSGYKDAVTLI